MAKARTKPVKKPTSAIPLPRKLRARVRGATLELLEPMPVSLRDGEEVTVTVSPGVRKPDLDALRRSFGAWKGHIDAEALIKDIYASRAVKSRRPVPRF